MNILFVLWPQKSAGSFEVRIGEPGVHAIAVGERAFDVGHDLGLRTLHGSRGGGASPLAFEHK
jgi:hypothetical protein